MDAAGLAGRKFGRNRPGSLYSAQVASAGTIMMANRKTFLLGFLLLGIVGLNGQIPANPLQPANAATSSAAPQQDPYDRLSPQNSVIAFLETCGSGNFERAARYLNLSQKAPDQRRNDGPRLAQELGQVLDRDTSFDVADLSKDPRGDDAIHATGTALAIPTQASVFYSEPSDNAEVERMKRLARESGSSGSR